MANVTCTAPATRSLPAMAMPRRIEGRGVLRAVVDTLLLWHARADQRRALGVLEDWQLRDIGLKRDAVEREIRKPFWQA